VPELRTQAPTWLLDTPTLHGYVTPPAPGLSQLPIVDRITRVVAPENHFVSSDDPGTSFRVLPGCARDTTGRDMTHATPFNYLEYPTDSVLLVVVYRLHSKLGLRDVAEMFLERGFECTQEAVRDWEALFSR
jgi:hypothetical protein